MKVSKTLDAIAFAAKGHDSVHQYRKYSLDPYIVHPIAVIKILTEAGEEDEDVLTAAALHDIFEDVWPKLLLENDERAEIYSPDNITVLFGGKVTGIVTELTDVYTPEAYPDLNRAGRKVLEAERLGTISFDSMKVKLADLIDNTKDICDFDRGFAVKYLKEKEKILDKFRPRIESHGIDILHKLLKIADTQIHNELT